MAIPSFCPECNTELHITRSGVVGPDTETTAECPSCDYEEIFD